MKKEVFVALCAIGLLIVGVTSANAANVTWQILENPAMSGHGPGNDKAIGNTGDSTTGEQNNCNFNTGPDCASSGTPYSGTYSYAYLQFQQNSSCVLGGNAGAACSSGGDCASTVCVDCNTTLGKQTWSYFAKNTNVKAGKGGGTITDLKCENTTEFKAMAIGTSEAVSGEGGGGCITYEAWNSGSGCGVGGVSSDFDGKLWSSSGSVEQCTFEAGTMPGLSLAGRIYGATATVGICDYTPAEVQTIINYASGNYLMITCGSGTMPDPIGSPCLADAPWYASIVADTTGDVPTQCAASCGGSCMMGTAEDVE
jgi:hypothetical protein